MPGISIPVWTALVGSSISVGSILRLAPLSIVIEYSYDRNGNRTERDNLLNSSFDETYTYDGLNQLSSFDRSTTRSQSWDYDALGNWDSVTTDSVAETRGHNEQNEITSVSGATTPTYDANGNMTGDETGRQFVYDAWNRLVEVKDSGGLTLTEYKL